MHCLVCGSPLDATYNCVNAWMHEVWLCHTSPVDAFDVTCPRCGGLGAIGETNYDVEWEAVPSYSSRVCPKCHGAGKLKVRMA